MSLPKPSEKLSALENGLMGTAKRVGELETLVFSLARENDMMRDAFGLLNQKLDAALSLISEGISPTSDNINARAVSIKEANLENTVKELVENGRLSLGHEISENTFVVGRELRKDGTVANPRLQFPVRGLSEEEQQTLMGKKTGDMIEGKEENSLNFEILEVYDIVENEMQVAVAPKTESQQEGSVAQSPEA